MAPNDQLKKDAIAALQALGHKLGEATRMVNAAIQATPNANTPQELIKAAYALPREMRNGKPTSQAVNSPYASTYYVYRSGAHTVAHNTELLQVANAIGPGLSVEEFDTLGARVEAIQANRRSMTNYQFQRAIWAIPESFAAGRESPVHFEPLRDSAGRPISDAIEPPPQKAIERLAPPSPPEPISADALRGISGAPVDPEPAAVAPREFAPGRSNSPVEDASPRRAHAPISSTVEELRRPPASTPTVGEEARRTPASTPIADEESRRTLAPTVISSEARDNLMKQAAIGASATQVETQSQSINTTNVLGNLLGPVSEASQLQSDTRQTHTVIQSTAGPQAITGMLNAEPTEPPSPTTSTLDNVQMAADAIGVIDQTGVTDLANAGVSIARAFIEPGRAGEHLVNASVSAVSAIPIIGDVAKLFKYGGKGANLAADDSRVNKSTNAAFGKVDGHHGLSNLLRRGKAIDNTSSTFGATAENMSAHHTIAGGGETPIDLGQYATGAIGDDSRQAARDLESFGGAIEGFLNSMGAGVATLGAVGSVVCDRALKPIIDWLKQIDDTSKQMLADNRNLAAYSGELGAAMQRLDTERFLRDVDRAQDMSGSLSKLAGSQSRYEQSQQDLTGPYKLLAVEMQSWRTEVANYITKAIDSIDFIGTLIEWWLQEERDTTSPKNDVQVAAKMLDEFLAKRKL